MLAELLAMADRAGKNSKGGNTGVFRQQQQKNKTINDSIYGSRTADAQTRHS